MAKSWHPPAPSPAYPRLKSLGMRGRVQDHHREPTVERVVARARSLAGELEPGPRELMMQLAALVEAEHEWIELLERELRAGMKWS